MISIPLTLKLDRYSVPRIVRMVNVPEVEIHVPTGPPRIFVTYVLGGHFQTPKRQGADSHSH